MPAPQSYSRSVLLLNQLDSLLRQYSLPDYLWHLMRTLSLRASQTAQTEGRSLVFGRGEDARTLTERQVRDLIDQLGQVHNWVVDHQMMPSPTPVQASPVDKSYTVGTDEIGVQTITCSRCGRTSHNQSDVLMKYCANCDWMHEHNRPRTQEDIDEFRRRQA